jgi:hypothetical protein
MNNFNIYQQQKQPCSDGNYITRALFQSRPLTDLQSKYRMITKHRLQPFPFIFSINFVTAPVVCLLQYFRKASQVERFVKYYGMNDELRGNCREAFEGTI